MTEVKTDKMSTFILSEKSKTAKKKPALLVAQQNGQKGKVTGQAAIPVYRIARSAAEVKKLCPGFQRLRPLRR